MIVARVVELVDTQVSEACAAMHASSSLASGTILIDNHLRFIGRSSEVVFRRSTPQFYTSLAFENGILPQDYYWGEIGERFQIRGSITREPDSLGNSKDSRQRTLLYFVDLSESDAAGVFYAGNGHGVRAACHTDNCG